MWLVLLTALLARPALSAEGWRVIDGDGLVAPWGEELRVANIDTPEVGKRCKCPSECALGDRATTFTREAIRKARRVILAPYSEPGRKFKEYGQSGPLDRFRRSLVLVSLDGTDLGDRLIREGLARKWDGKRRPWCQ
jgi:micrococcal nuclease